MPCRVCLSYLCMRMLKGINLGFGFAAVNLCNEIGFLRLFLKPMFHKFVLSLFFFLHSYRK